MTYSVCRFVLTSDEILGRPVVLEGIYIIQSLLGGCVSRPLECVVAIHPRDEYCDNLEAVCRRSTWLSDREMEIEYFVLLTWNVLILIFCYSIVLCRFSELHLANLL